MVAEEGDRSGGIGWTPPGLKVACRSIRLGPLAMGKFFWHEERDFVWLARTAANLSCDDF